MSEKFRADNAVDAQWFRSRRDATGCSRSKPATVHD
jgi:hypothetical protein